MPEYFEISILLEKEHSAVNKLMEYIRAQFQLSVGENHSTYFRNSKVIVSCVQDNEADYEGIDISIAEWRFNENCFSEDLEIITSFVTALFNCCHSLAMVVCSYELNGYLLGSISHMVQLKRETVLTKFPIYYLYNHHTEKVEAHINMEAQHIF